MFDKSLNGITWLRQYAPILFLFPVLLVGLLPGPVLLGVWESLTFYHTFGSVDAPLSFLIAPRANIGGQGYALLEIGRSIILGLGLPLNLQTFRIPAVAFGIVSLLIFFRICKRYFGPWPALGTTALLAGNQLFFQMQHMMTVLVISGAALLFVIERLQALEVKYWDKKTWFGLGLSMAIVALHYGPARIFSVILIGLWIVKASVLLRRIPGAATIQTRIWKSFGYSIFVCLLLLILLDFRNLVSILRFPNFLFPQNSDIAVLEFGPESTGGVDLVKTVEINAYIFLESLFGLVGKYNSQYSTYVFSDYRYPLLDVFVVPFVFLGFFLSVFLIRRRTIILATPFLNSLMILGVSSAPLLLSVVMFQSGVLQSTLSVHRMYFCLFPLHFLIAAFLSWLMNSNIANFAKYAVAICIVFVFGYQISNLIGESYRFKEQVFSSKWQLHGAVANGYWADDSPNLDRQGSSFRSHLQQHAQYANVAKAIAVRLRTLDKDQPQLATHRLVYVDVNIFSESPIMPETLPYIANRNFHSIFLALYAGQEGIKLNPIVMIGKDRKPIGSQLLGNLGYRGKQREYSALMELKEDGRLIYVNGQELIPVVARLTGSSVYDILVTTPEEENSARSLFDKQGVNFEYIKIF